MSGGPRGIAVPNFIKIGQSIAEIQQFFDFSRWRPLPSSISEIRKFYYLRGSGWRDASLCQISSKSVNLLQRYSNFLIIQDGGRPPSLICLGHILTMHEGYLVVTISIKFGCNQRSSIKKYEFEFFCAIGLKMPICATKIGFWRNLTPLMDGIIISVRPQKDKSLCESASFEPSTVKSADKSEL